MTEGQSSESEAEPPHFGLIMLILWKSGSWLKRYKRSTIKVMNFDLLDRRTSDTLIDFVSD